MYKFGWHFNNGYLGYKDGRKIEVGETLSVEEKPRLCQRGLHATEDPSYAITYGMDGHNLDYVQVWGDVEEMDNKFCGRNRKVVKRIEPDRLRELTVKFMIFILEACSEKQFKDSNPHLDSSVNRLRALKQAIIDHDVEKIIELNDENYEHLKIDIAPAMARKLTIGLRYAAVVTPEMSDCYMVIEYCCPALEEFPGELSNKCKAFLRTMLLEEINAGV